MVTKGDDVAKPHFDREYMSKTAVRPEALLLRRSPDSAEGEKSGRSPRNLTPRHGPRCGWAAMCRSGRHRLDFILLSIFLAIVLFSACKDGHQHLLPDLLESAWIEQDVAIVPANQEGAPYFMSGFLAAGDSGRAMRHRKAIMAFYAVSAGGKRISLDLKVPECGGRLKIGVRGRQNLHSRNLDGGIQHVSFTIDNRIMVRGYNRLNLEWHPSSSPNANFRRLTVKKLHLHQEDSKKPLSRAIMDSVTSSLVLGPGCKVLLHIAPGKKATMHGSVSGSGMARIRVGTNDKKPKSVWETRINPDDDQELHLSLAQWNDERAVEISIETGRNGDETIWSGLRFSDIDPNPWLISADSLHIGDEVGSSELSNGPHVILYLVDTVRRDRMQLYGYERPTTPHILNGKSEWFIWDDCRSLSSWTKSATASLLTALDPMQHGAIDDDDSLSSHHTMIWEDLHDSGYETALFSTNGHISKRWGFTRSIDHYRQFREYAWRKAIHFPADSLHGAFLNWLDLRREPNRPFFAYLHATDPHIPYTPPSSFLRNIYPDTLPVITELSVQELSKMICPGIRAPWETEVASALYDAEIAAWDAAFADLLDGLALRKILDKSIIIVTSDHGEEFHEHGGFSHGVTLYREQLEIPLMARVPGFPGGRSSLPIDHRDVADLIYWLVHGNDPHAWSPTDRELRIAHLSLRGSEIARLDDGRESLIWNISPQKSCDRAGSRLELYINGSPELDNLYSHRGATSRAKRSALHGWIESRAHTRGVSRLDEELVERLRFLGYMTDE